MMRPLIQYDLDEPPTGPSLPVAAPPHPLNARRPPTKKRKRNHRNPQKYQPAQPHKIPLQHWDDPGSSIVGMVYDEQEGSAAPPVPLNLVAESVKVSAYVDDVKEGEEEHGEEAMEGVADVEEEEEEEEGEEESRPLTHEEIWDDAALIDAWNSAAVEYEAYHGTSKAWKTESVKKSPLWYNKPYTAPPKPGPSKPNARSNNIPPSSPQAQEGGEPDTAPLDFDTYVPTHDPSLAIQSNGTTANPATIATPFFVPPPSTTMVSCDEAFNNALSSMYWSGYWTAVYHCQSQSGGKANKVPAEGIEENGIEADEDEDEEDLVPTQR